MVAKGVGLGLGKGMDKPGTTTIQRLAFVGLGSWGTLGGVPSTPSHYFTPRWGPQETNPVDQ